MREELKNFDWHCYGLKSSDIDYTLRIIEEMIESRKDSFNREAEKVRNEQPDVADDILDDVAYYTWVDILFTWEYCVWRLQGILEGIIVSKYLAHLSNNRKKKLKGLKSRLDMMVEEGFAISEENYQELLDWGKLRNALSHHPPEQYRPSHVTEEDVKEYANLLKELFQAWDVDVIRVTGQNNAI